MFTKIIWFQGCIHLLGVENKCEEVDETATCISFRSVVPLHGSQHSVSYLQTEPSDLQQQQPPGAELRQHAECGPVRAQGAPANYNNHYNNYNYHNYNHNYKCDHNNDSSSSCPAASVRTVGGWVRLPHGQG